MAHIYIQRACIEVINIGLDVILNGSQLAIAAELGGILSIVPEVIDME